MSRGASGQNTTGRHTFWLIVLMRYLAFHAGAGRLGLRKGHEGGGRGGRVEIVTGMRVCIH